MIAPSAPNLAQAPPRRMNTIAAPTPQAITIPNTFSQNFPPRLPSSSMLVFLLRNASRCQHFPARAGPRHRPDRVKAMSAGGAAGDLRRPRLETTLPAPGERGREAEDQRGNRGQEPIDEHRRNHARPVPAEPDQRPGQAELDHADPARGDRKGSDDADQRPGGECFDEGDL